MAMTADILIEKIKLKKQITKWKIVALSILFISILLFSFSNNQSPTGDYIARVSIEDIILENTKRTEKIKNIADNKSIKAVIFRINSPGGTAYGGEQLYEAIRLVAQKKPTVSVIGTVAASGGYMTAIASDYIVAGRTSITGSIGVIMQSFDARNLLGKIGISPYSFKSSELKASPSPFEEVTPKVKHAIDASIQDTFSVFKQMVKERRALSENEIEIVADGRVFTGLQAKELKLIDDIGAEDEALAWLEKNKNISSKLKIKDVKTEDKPKFFEEIFDTKIISNFIFSLSQNKFLLAF